MEAVLLADERDNRVCGHKHRTDIRRGHGHAACRFPSVKKQGGSPGAIFIADKQRVFSVQGHRPDRTLHSVIVR